MPRHITISLEQRGVMCRARLLDDLAPTTSQAVWDALPTTGDAYHGKFARNEVYALVPRITAAPRRENPTVTPLPRDVCLFDYDAWEIGNPAFGFEEDSLAHDAAGATDLAIFYGRNNLLLNGDVGWVPGSVFATIEDGYDEMASACDDIWRHGFAGERMTFTRG